MHIRSKLFYCYAVFVAVYTLITILPAPDHATLIKYHLSPTSLRLLDVTLLIPTFVMWFAVFYGYARLHRYGQLIESTRDGRQIIRLANGLLILALGLPLASILSSLLGLIARAHAGFVPASAIISNYMSIAYPLAAFVLINKGARNLAEHSRTSPGFRITNLVVLGVIVLGVIFCDLIAHAHHGLITIYHMSYGLIMLTMAIPYMYTWFLGLFAMAELYVYSKELAGVVYRKGWNRLAIGIGSVIMIDISLQYLGTLSTWLNRLSLTDFLLLLYVLLLLLAGGFIVIALGAKDLMKIEEA